MGSPIAETPATSGKLDPAAFAPDPSVPPGHEVATFATGCFWCSETDFEKVVGVLSVTSGYTGGPTDRPKYKAVGRGGTGHTDDLGAARWRLPIAQTLTALHE